MEAAIGVILLIVAVIGVIAIVNIIDSSSKRERGIPKKDRKRIRRGKGNGGKHEE